MAAGSRSDDSARKARRTRRASTRVREQRERNRPLGRTLRRLRRRSPGFTSGLWDSLKSADVPVPAWLHLMALVLELVFCAGIVLTTWCIRRLVRVVCRCDWSQRPKIQPSPLGADERSPSQVVAACPCKRRSPNSATDFVPVRLRGVLA